MSTDRDASRDQTSYHHGDLRRTILAAAVDVIAAEGSAALSLRDLARRAGVSHAAPAHHFKDRTGLLTAVATEAYTLFADSLSEVTDFREQGARYVRFAADHPAHFQVMFQPGLYRGDDPALAAARERAARVLREGVAGPTTDGSGADAGDARRTGWPPGPWPTASPRCC